MSKSISIKVVVAGRTYPLTVTDGEEEKVYKAADDINKSIKILQENYAVKDMQDLLAMTALQLSAKSSNKESIPAERIPQDTDDSKIKEVEKRLENLLNELEKA